MEYPFKDLMPLDEVLAREGYYKDWTHIDANTFHQISELVKFIREKGYGADTREAIAQALERVYYDAMKSGNADMELSMARKHFKDLASRLNASDDKLASATAQLAQKATKTELQSVASGSPKGVYATLTELQNAKPTGDTNIYVVNADNNWYYWNGTDWISGGLYQNLNTYVDKYYGNGGTKDVGGSTPPFGGGFMRIDKSPFTRTGILKSVEFNATVSASVKIKFFQLIDNVLYFKGDFPLNASSGNKKYISGVDFTEIKVEKGWLIGYQSADTNFSVNMIDTPGVVNSYAFAGDVVTDIPNASPGGNNYHMAIYGEVEVGIKEILNKIDTIINMDRNEETTSTIMSTKFSGSSLPDRFINNGFTINNGAKSPTTGGWDKNIYFSSYSTLDENTVRARVKINDTNCNFALLKRDNRNIASTIGQVDCVNKKLILRNLWDNNVSTIADVVVEGVIPFNFVAGREYLVELEIKTVRITVLRITDGITGESFEIENDHAVTGRRTSGWGSPCVTAISGDFTVKKLEYVSDQPTKAKLAIYGDSFVEGDSMLSVGHENRYSTKLKNKLNGDVLICGRGGETSAGLILKFDDDFMHFKPKYTLLAIGTNQDSSVATTWITNIQSLIKKVESRGSIPVLMTLTVNIAGANWATYMTDINNWIMNSGYRYVDANLVTTVNQDRLTQDTSMFFADGVHPNTIGHDMIYKRFLVDVPEIFDFD